MALGLCFVQAFFSCSEQGLLFLAVHRLIAVASRCGTQALGHTGSIVAVHGFSCPKACGIFLDQGLNQCPPHW